MNKKLKIIGIIPARGGSKRLPKKNIVSLGGKPLLVHTIEASMNCSLICDTVVSTDSDEIYQLASNYNVILHQRSPDLANDHIKNNRVVEDVIKYLASKNMQPDIIVLLQPTSPLRSSIHLAGCLSHFINSDAESSISICVSEVHPDHCIYIENDFVKPFTQIENFDKRTNELKTAYRPNGAIYAVKTNAFLKNLSFFQEPCLPYLMSVEDSIDIDDQKTLSLAEKHFAMAT